MILDGKMCSQIIKDKLKKEIQTFKITPKLIDIQIGDNEASEIYIANKAKAAMSVGIDFECIRFTNNNTELEIINKIEELNKDDKVFGILIQLPIHPKFNYKKIVNAISFKKDVDGLTDINVGKLNNNNDGLVSCTPLGIIELLKYYKIELLGKNVVIVGRSNLVGKPLINLFLNEDATLTICHSKTSNLEYFTKNADVLIVAVGKKHLITKNMVKKGAVVIDVGINRVDNKIYGDVDFDNVKEIVSYISPVPGGVGPMTIAMLLSNVVKSYKFDKLD
ncbi:MAG: bifunctional 5,10-methylenetetrahydrofolate dehydrogenase/5,10-methenyltetrahydrofolate cyclohydrolase [Bacilli bacterium]